MCQNETGVRTVAGEDLMVLDVGEDLELSRARTYPENEFWVPDWCPPKDFIDHHPK